MEIPSREEIQQIFDTYHTADNVREHVELVRDVAVSLGKKLVETGEQVDLALVEAGALLHDFIRFVGMQQIKLNYLNTPPSYEDMAKWRELDNSYKGLNHAQAAGQELRRLGYPESLALVVERHDFDKIIDPEDGPQTWEEKLVFYADKRVLHRSIASLEERFKDGMERYPEFANAAGEHLKRAAIYELEKEIFDTIGLHPEDITI